MMITTLVFWQMSIRVGGPQWGGAIVTENGKADDKRRRRCVGALMA